MTDLSAAILSALRFSVFAETLSYTVIVAADPASIVPVLRGRLIWL